MNVNISSIAWIHLITTSKTSRLFKIIHARTRKQEAHIDDDLWSKHVDNSENLTSGAGDELILTNRCVCNFQSMMISVRAASSQSGHVGFRYNIAITSL